MQAIQTIGRRKDAIARIYVSPGTGSITVNGKDFKTYFPTESLQNEVLISFRVTNTLGMYDVVANVNGGGVTGQAGAIKMALARALDKDDNARHGALKTNSLLTRDPRMVERKKFGRRKARKRFQFSKR